MATAMMNKAINQINGMLPFLLQMPKKKFWLDYDSDVDVLYVNFQKPQRATDSEMLKNGILFRYKDTEVVGFYDIRCFNTQITTY